MMIRRLVLIVCMTLMTASPVWAQDAGKNYFEMFFRSEDFIGQCIIILLVLMSLASIALSIRFALVYRKGQIIPEQSEADIEAMISKKRYREAIEYAMSDDSYLGQVTSAALREASNGYGSMERAIEEEGDAQTTKMLRPLEYLNVLGQVSPMIGLFGTVYGMIVAFQKLVVAGSPEPSELAGGISTALVTTLWGLVVAIPALSAYSIIRNRVDAFTAEGMLVTERLIATFKPGAKSSSSSGSSSRNRATPQPE